MFDQALKKHLNERAWTVLEKAGEHCGKLIERVTAITDKQLIKIKVSAKDACFIVVGSVGRLEALQASDIDIIPVLRTPEALAEYQPHDQAIRQALRDGLKIEVSKGEDLTCCIDLPGLIEADSIGGSKDTSSTLTRRILLLTEGKQAGGKWPLAKVQREVMEAYAGAERTRGRHVLSLCNDIARYYRTLCIEYKAKADDPAKDWCTRNMKLRHSRKFWYLSCIMTLVDLADPNPQGDEPYITGLLKAFGKPPFQRLFDAVDTRHWGTVGRIVEAFTWFLDFMSIREHRDKLKKVEHGKRYEMKLDNPFHAVKLNSDRMHQEMICLIDSLPTHQRHRIANWFLL